MDIHQSNQGRVTARKRCRTTTLFFSADCVFADGIKLGLAERSGVFRLAQYGPINSLSIRKNEVLLTVQL